MTLQNQTNVLTPEGEVPQREPDRIDKYHAAFAQAMDFSEILVSINQMLAKIEKIKEEGV